MEVSSLPMSVFYEIYGDNISAEVYENFVTPLDRTRCLLIAAYSVLFLIGACGNGWVACVITCVLKRSRSTEAPKSVQIFILALCCCDLLVLTFLTLLIIDLAYGRWVIQSSWLCLLYLISESLNKFCSPFLLMALSCLCYLSICQRPNYRFSISTSDFRTPLMIVLFCFVLMFLLVAPVYIYGDVHFVIFENGTDLWAVLPKCAFQPPEQVLRIFTMYTFVFGYIIPAALFTYFYSAVLMYVRRHARHCTVSSLHFWRVAKTTMGLVLFYLCCWTPYWSLNMYEYFRPLSTTPEQSSVQSDTMVILGYFIHTLPYICCCGYPILYTALNRNITQAYDNVKSCRNGRKRRRSMIMEYRGSPSRIATAKLTSAGVQSDNTPSPIPSSLSYLANHCENGNFQNSTRFGIRISVTSEMTTLAPFNNGHPRSVSSNTAFHYGSFV